MIAYVMRIDDWLRGRPEHAITAALVLSAIILLLIALYARPSLKVAALAWVLFP